MDKGEKKMKPKKHYIKNKKHLEIQKYLVVSTVHITEEEDEYLHDDVYSQLSVYTTDYGHSIFVPHENLKEFEGMVGKNVLSLLKIAKKNGCCYLKLDRDGFIYEDLPQFDW
jgi:hypothetical protein